MLSFTAQYIFKADWSGMIDQITWLLHFIIEMHGPAYGFLNNSAVLWTSVPRKRIAVWVNCQHVWRVCILDRCIIRGQTLCS